MQWGHCSPVLDQLPDLIIHECRTREVPAMDDSVATLQSASQPHPTVQKMFLLCKICK